MTNGLVKNKEIESYEKEIEIKWNTHTHWDCNKWFDCKWIIQFLFVHFRSATRCAQYSFAWDEHTIFIKLALLVLKKKVLWLSDEKTIIKIEMNFIMFHLIYIFAHCDALFTYPFVINSTKSIKYFISEIMPKIKSFFRLASHTFRFDDSSNNNKCKRYTGQFKHLYKLVYIFFFDIDLNSVFFRKPTTINSHCTNLKKGKIKNRNYSLFR